MNKMITALVLFFSTGQFAGATDAPPDAASLLRDSDRARGAVAATEGITWTVAVDTKEKGDKTSITYTVKVKGDDALAEAIEPARNKGEIMLFNDRNIWFFKPGLKKPVSISPRQKLMGQAANGDIASTNYARDYDGVLKGEEKANNIDCWRLELKAKAKNVTYDKINYWISKADRQAIKAEFLTVSGKVFKSADFQYGNKMTVKGSSYPFISVMTITDATNTSLVTTLKYSSPKAESHADSLFNVNNLLR